MTFKGCNLRQSATHPDGADSADDTYWHASANEAYATATRSPFTGGFGYDSTSGSWSGADRSGTGVDIRLAGLVYNGGANAAFKFKLPNGAGEYKFRLAAGDRLAARSGMTWALKDGATTLHSGSGSTTAADKFVDANGTEHTAANWPGSNTTATVTFSGDVATVEFGAGAFITHIAFEPTAAAAPTFTGPIPTLTGTQGVAFAAQSPTIASYFTGATSYSISPALPAGLSFNTTTTAITGTPSTDTDWLGTVTGINGTAPNAVSNSFSITIGAPAADLSSPTVTSVGATTATCGFSTDTATGNGYFLRRTGLSAASAATIIGTGESQSISGTGAQTRAMTAFTSGLTYYVDMAQTGSTEVVTAGPFYPGTGRPVSDISVTGWTASTGSDLWAMLDEDTASDSDYVTSPALSGSATTGSHALDKTYPAGTYSIKVRAKTDTGAGTLAVRLLNGSNVSQGVTANQAITSTWTTYTLAITTTGDATRIRYEVVAA